MSTEFATAQEVLLKIGDLVEFVVASAAIPGVFPPMTIAGHRLVDGGIAKQRGYLTCHRGRSVDLSTSSPSVTSASLTFHLRGLSRKVRWSR